MKLKLMKAFDRALGAWIDFFSQKRTNTYQSRSKKILIIKLSAMGDALCLMPSLRLIKSSQPEMEIHWLTTTRSNPKLFEPLKFIHQQWILPTNPLGMLGFITRHCWSDYDAIIDCDQYYRLSEWIALKGRYSAGFQTPLKGQLFNHKLIYDASANEKKTFFDLIRTALNVKETTLSSISVALPELANPSLVSQDEMMLMSSLPPAIVVYPGSSLNAAMRRWPLERYQTLAQQLLNKGFSVVIAGGSDEKNIQSQFDNLGAHNWIGKLSLNAWSWFFANRALLFIGNDAGLLHIAEAQSLPNLSLFGPNIGSKWGSINPLSISMEDSTLSCRPCIKTHLGQIPQHCARGDLACLNGISVEMVLDTALKQIQRLNTSAMPPVRDASNGPTDRLTHQH